MFVNASTDREKTDPKRTFPRTATDVLMRMKFLIDTEAPRDAKPIKDRADAMREKPRSDIEEPSAEKPNTDSENTEPMAFAPMIDSALLSLKKFLRERADPMLDNPNTDRAAPSRAYDRSETEEPMRAKLHTAREEPNLA